MLSVKRLIQDNTPNFIAMRNLFYFFVSLNIKAGIVLSLLRCLDTSFGLVIGFIEHLKIVTTIHYGAIANSHNLQFTTARTKTSHSAVSSPIVAW
jgi:hypothetical protein